MKPETVAGWTPGCGNNHPPGDHGRRSASHLRSQHLQALGADQVRRTGRFPGTELAWLYILPIIKYKPDDNHIGTALQFPVSVAAPDIAVLAPFAFSLFPASFVGLTEESVPGDAFAELWPNKST